MKFGITITTFPWPAEEIGPVVSRIAVAAMMEEPYFVMFWNHGIAFPNHAATADGARRDKTRSAAFSPLLKDSSVQRYPQSP